MADAIVSNKGQEFLPDLPPGFRFHPTDEEIITHYLLEKVMNSNFSACAIGEADLNKSEPWELPHKAKMGEKEWYFFCQKDRKYPTGMRTNRATEAGLEGKSSYYNLTKSAKDEWVVCRVFHKNTEMKKSPIPDHLLRMNSIGHEFMDYASLPPLMELTFDFENELKAPISNTQIPNQNPILFHQGTSSDSYPDGFRTDDEAIIRAPTADNSSVDIEHKQCKVEQFSSNQSMTSLSQNTWLSTDINNNEISSVISNGIQLGSFKCYDDIEDLTCLWNY
ncbi:hypothetical protein GQ457_08G013550 [Hibiscus cannabinus]